MGIKPTYIKKIATELLEFHEEKFTNDFYDNKKAVMGATNVPSKRVRNRCRIHHKKDKYWEIHKVILMFEGVFPH